MLSTIIAPKTKLWVGKLRMIGQLAHVDGLAGFELLINVRSLWRV